MNLCIRAIILLVVLLLSVAGRARAGDVLTLREGAQTYAVNRYLAVLEDPGGTLALQDVRPRFTFPDTEARNFGFSASAYWVRFDVVNRHPALSEWLLEYQYPLIDRVEITIERAGGRLETAVSGDTVPFSSRAVRHRFPMFKLVLARDERVSVYLRVRSDGALLMPLVLRSTAEVMARDHDEQYLLGIYYGILLAMFIYNSMLYLSVRDRNYLSYSAYVGAWAMMQLAINGLAFEYLWPQSPRWGNMAVLFFLGMAISSTCLFTLSFLDVRRHFPRLAAILQVYAWLGVFIMAAVFFMPLSILIKVGQAGALSGALFFFVVGIVCLKQGGLQARYFLLGWSMLLVGAILFVLQNSGVIPTVFITEYGLQIGSAVEVLLFSFALAHRMKLLQEDNIRIQREAAENLEQRVAQRTLELDGALEKLSDAHQRLKDLSRIDGLTGIKNRACFNEQISVEWQRGMREKQALGILMIDIDHFKAINDTFGHLNGDICLKEVAHTLAHQVHRISDDAFRFGGEEFVVMLPNTDLGGALHMGEVMRDAVESLNIVLGGVRIPVTISVGVACMAAAPGVPVEALIGSADLALYQAKHGGRNRVCAGENGPAPAKMVS